MTIKNNVYTVDQPYDTSDHFRLEYTFEDAIATTGFGKYNILIVLIGGFAILGVLTESMGMSFILPLAECEFELTSARKGYLTSMTLLGILLTAQFWGYMGDTRGRRVMILPAFLSVISTLISSLVTSFYLLLLFRFITGLLVGSTAAICYAFVSEFHGGKHRQNALAWTSSFVALSYVILPGLAWVLLPQTWVISIPFLNINYTSWRLFILLCCVPSLTCGILAYFFPESPRYLLQINKIDEALKILEKMYEWNTGKPKNTFPVKNLVMSETHTKSTANFFVTAYRQTVPIFKPPYLGKSLLMCFLQFGCFFSSLGFYNWLPQILLDLFEYENNGNIGALNTCDILNRKLQNSHQNINGTLTFDSEECLPPVSQITMYQSTFVLGLISYVCYSSIAAIIKFAGNKLILLILLTVSGIGGITLHYVDQPWLIMTLLGFFVLSMITVGVVNTFTPDMYPTKYRAMAISISFMFGRIGGVCGSNLAAYLLEINCHWTFNIYGGLLLICGAFALLLPAKT